MNKFLAFAIVISFCLAFVDADCSNRIYNCVNGAGGVLGTICEGTCFDLNRLSCIPCSK